MLMRWPAALFVVALASCGGLLSPGPDPIEVVSIPPGASIFVADQYRGTAPMTVRLGRQDLPRDKVSIRAVLDGYWPAEKEVARVFNGHTTLNILFLVPLGFPIFMAIDLACGDVRKWPQIEPLVFTLSKRAP
jgi:hypothetical protein